MVKTAEFGQPCAAVPVAGRCRICGYEGKDWADETRTLCKWPGCVTAAKREIGR